MEGVPIKILGRATLNPTRIIPNLNMKEKTKRVLAYYLTYGSGNTTHTYPLSPGICYLLFSKLWNGGASGFS